MIVVIIAATSMAAAYVKLTGLQGVVSCLIMGEVCNAHLTAACIVVNRRTSHSDTKGGTGEGARKGGK